MDGGELYSLLAVQPVTGRTHQIRAHMASIKHPLVSDTKYAPSRVAKRQLGWCNRLFLHAGRLELGLELGGEAAADVSSALPAELEAALSCLEDAKQGDPDNAAPLEPACEPVREPAAAATAAAAAASPVARLVCKEVVPPWGGEPCLHMELRVREGGAEGAVELAPTRLQAVPHYSVHPRPLHLSTTLDNPLRMPLQPKSLTAMR